MDNCRIKLSPSILAADFGKLIEEVREVENLVDSFHVDVMDGHFVPNISFGPLVSNALKKAKIDASLVIHLMITDPRKYAPAFKTTKEDTIIFHVETSPDPLAMIKELKKLNTKVGASLNPGTDPSPLLKILPKLDQVLVMSVNPGFGGQKFMSETLETISLFKEEITKLGLPTQISVDGGINSDTISKVVKAGADIAVVGSAIFGAPDRAQAVSKLRKAASKSSA